MIIQNGAPIIGGGDFELKLFNPVCHEGSAVVLRITNSVSSMNDWNVKSSLLDSESSVCGVKDELGGFVSVGTDPFLSGNEVEEGVGEER